MTDNSILVGVLTCSFQRQAQAPAGTASGKLLGFNHHYKRENEDDPIRNRQFHCFND